MKMSVNDNTMGRKISLLFLENNKKVLDRQKRTYYNLTVRDKTIKVEVRTYGIIQE